MKKLLLLGLLSVIGFSTKAQGDSLDCALIADFTYSIADGNLYLTNTSTDEPAWPFYEWSVDGMYYYEENPTVSTAEFEASELVCLTVYDSLEECSDMVCMTIYFEEDTLVEDSTDCALIASFTYSISGGNLYLTNTSTDEPAWPFYEWSVDGMYYYEENPTISTADFEASELVCLTVYDSLEECSDMVCMTIYFEEDTLIDDSTDCELVASFTYSISGGNLYLTNTSTDEPAWPFYEWSVDGMFYYEENPTISTADFEASEEVCLTVYDSLEDCSDMVCMTIYFDDDSSGTDSTASIASYNTLDVNVYPNPARDILNVTLKNVSSPQEIKLYNAVGELVRLEQAGLKTEQLTMDVSTLPQGLYIIHIIDLENSELSIQKKLIKE